MVYVHRMMSNEDLTHAIATVRCGVYHRGSFEEVEQETCREEIESHVSFSRTA